MATPMKFRLTHPLISAYAALATIAIGLLTYGGEGSKPTAPTPTTAPLVIESVAKPEVERIASNDMKRERLIDR
jgi:hypothetical protein